LSGEFIAQWRMRNLRLTGAPLDAPEDVVRWLGAVQAQDYGPAKWSIGHRTGAITDAALDRAFADARLLRTHVLRPTWHFVLPADIRWMLQLTGPRVHALNAYYSRQLELDDAVLAQSTAVLVEALRDGHQLTRKELQARLDRAGIATPGFRMAYILMHAELNAVICSGALSGKQHTYALLDERAPPAKRLTHDEALAELTLRYFTSHGPASVKDFKWWSSLTAAQIKHGLEMVRPQLKREVIDGVTYWFGVPPPSDPRALPAVHLLQGYDEYAVGYSETKYVLDVTGRARSTILDRSVFIGLTIIDTQVAGHWKRTLTKDSVALEVALYAEPDAAQRHALATVVRQHGEFLGLSATLVISTI
jgi:hypothetical protein